jgi:hypothetical protein
MRGELSPPRPTPNSPTTSTAVTVALAMTAPLVSVMVPANALEVPLCPKVRIAFVTTTAIHKVTQTQTTRELVNCLSPPREVASGMRGDLGCLTRSSASLKSTRISSEPERQNKTTMANKKRPGTRNALHTAMGTCEPGIRPSGCALRHEGGDGRRSVPKRKRK